MAARQATNGSTTARPARLAVLSVFGTRPEAIKMAPVIRELGRYPAEIASTVCVTGQHREMLDEVLEAFAITAHHDLDVMRPGQSPTGVAAGVLRRLEPVLADVRPDWVLVQGDTTTAAMAGLAAFYAGARVAHVEAGLRSHEPRRPFPEEVNRRVAAVVADVHFAPTASARENLLREGIADETVYVTGNTVIDALLIARSRPAPSAGAIDGLPTDKRIVVVTAHRRESFGAPLEQICAAVADLVEAFPDIHVAFPVHPNPSVRMAVGERLEGNDRVSLLPPLGYREIVALLGRAEIVLTDSGGLQEEAPSLGKPVLVLRDVTERWEAVEAGSARLVGTDRARIVAEASAVLSSGDAYVRMSRAGNPYGDGLAAGRIVSALRGLPVDEWVPGRDPRPIEELTGPQHVQLPALER
jgi:UDP-N-acetylglucosamine 2-epimerase (non-hydrolysing)